MGATTECIIWVQDISGAAFHQPRVELTGVEEEEMMNDAVDLELSSQKNNKYCQLEFSNKT